MNAATKVTMMVAMRSHDISFTQAWGLCYETVMGLVRIRMGLPQTNARTMYSTVCILQTKKYNTLQL